MRQTYLPFSPPALSDLEIATVVETLKTDWLSTGPMVKKLFEDEFREATVNAPAALALNSCTAGMHISVLVHRIGAGDEVITSPMTFCSHG